MKLKGSCQCEKVVFEFESETPYPFQFCFCSICRKLTGAATSNIMGKLPTLKIKGKKFLKCYHAIVRKRGQKPKKSSGERWFCGNCGSHLYVLDKDTPEGIWPNAAAIDTPLPVPKEQDRVKLMLRYKPEWVPALSKGANFSVYPKLSIAEWHQKHHPAK